MTVPPCPSETVRVNSTVIDDSPRSDADHTVLSLLPSTKCPTSGSADQEKERVSPSGSLALPESVKMPHPFMIAKSGDT